MPGSLNRATPCQTVPQLFFWDGDIILAAEHASTGVPVVYNLHHNVLSHHSRYLSGVIPQPATVFGEEGKDARDTRIISLSADPDALTPLLTFIYYPLSIQYFLRKDDPDICLKALPLLVLAREYGMQGVEAAIIARVEEAWPKTLREWDASDSHFAQKRDLLANPGIGLGVCQRWDEFLPEPASAIYLAHAMNIPSILPAAFYQLSRILPEDDFDGNRGEDGCFANGAMRPSARWSLLTKDDLAHLAAGRKAMSQYMGQFHSAMVKEVLFCSLKCRRAWVEARLLDTDDLLADLVDVCKPVPWLRMCGRCRMEVDEIARSMRASVWDGLPYAFGLVTSGSVC